MNYQGGQPASVRGLYQFIVAAGAVLFPGTSVNQVLTSGTPTADAVFAELQTSGLDLTGLDAETLAAFKQALAGLITNQAHVIKASSQLTSLVDEDYTGTEHSEGQLRNLFASAKGIEDAINLHVQAGGPEVTKAKGRGA
jgi:hypothetical protein